MPAVRSLGGHLGFGVCLGRDGHRCPSPPGRLPAPGVPIVQGRSDIEQMSKVFGLLGTPREQTWPSWEEMPDAGKLIFEDKKPLVDWAALSKPLVEQTKQGFQYQEEVWISSNSSSYTSNWTPSSGRQPRPSWNKAI